jgi:hypothetical protein
MLRRASEAAPTAMMRRGDGQRLPAQRNKKDGLAMAANWDLIDRLPRL